MNSSKGYRIPGSMVVFNRAKHRHPRPIAQDGTNTELRPANPVHRGLWRVFPRAKPQMYPS
ncbi:MAG TPA: hypothetical protein VKY92_21365 [Verrucomicrobiae bacterium]|nr:hypothetical protein [Verrucomicrobiae bacterium]